MSKIIVFIILLFNITCFGQSSDTTKIEDETFYLKEIPFIIKKGRNCIESDSIKGLIAIQLFIDNNADIIGFNIMHLDIKYLRSCKKVKFHKVSHQLINKEDYPNNVKPFIFFIDNYLNTLEIEKKKDSEVNKINKYIINLKIGN